MGDGDFSRWLRELERPDASAEARGEALRQASRLGRLTDALAAWAAARPPPGRHPIEPDLVEGLLEVGWGWGDPRLTPDALRRPSVSTWADDPAGPTRLVIHDDLSWSRFVPGTGGLIPLELPEGMPWSVGSGGSADIDVNAFRLAPGGTRALLAVTFTESPMLDAEEYAGLAVVDLAAGEVLEAQPSAEDFLFHAASPDLRGLVVGLFGQVRLRRVGAREELPLPLPGRFLQAWPGPGVDEVSVWWRPSEGHGRLDRLDVATGEIRGPGLEVGAGRVQVVPNPAPDTWVLWSSAPTSSKDQGRVRPRLQWVDVATGAIQREIRSRVPEAVPDAADAAGRYVGYPRELRKLSGLRVVGTYPARGPAEPGAPVPVPLGPVLQEIDPFDGRLLHGAEAARHTVWDLDVQGGTWLHCFSGVPGELRGRDLDGEARAARMIPCTLPALDRDQLVVRPVAGRGIGWRTDLLDPRSGQRRPVRWRGRGGQTCGTGDVSDAGLVAMGNQFAVLAVGRPDEPEPRWTLPREGRRYSPALRWFREHLVVFFIESGSRGELVQIDARSGRELATHDLGEVGFQSQRLRAGPEDAYLLLQAGGAWVLAPGGGPPRKLPVEEVEAVCPLDRERVVVVDGGGARRVFFLDGTPGPTRPGPGGVHALCALPGGERLAVARGAWIGFEPVPV